jgi:hypothetical protein
MKTCELYALPVIGRIGAKFAPKNATKAQGPYLDMAPAYIEGEIPKGEKT